MPGGPALTRGGGGGECLDDETLALLLEAALDPSEEAVVRTHIDRCDACRELFAEAARASESGLKRPSKRGRVIMYAPTEPGDIVARKYRVERAIGTGGMGHVFAARHLDLDQLVALKVMRPEMLHDQDAMRRFAREGKAAAALHSEHTVRILDVGRLEGGTPFIVMEYLEGRDLASILEKGGPLPFAEAIDYVIQACDALEEAHALGIIHRDLKPHNLFVTTGRHGEPFVKVLDFGLAKAIKTTADITSSAMTGTNVMLGSPFFMSPEQVDSRKDIDHRTDIWSLGATLYHIVTGVPPFVAPNIHLVCARILTEDFPPLARRRPDAPRELEAVLRRCMTRDLDARFPNVRELVAALRSVRALVSLGGVPSGMPSTRMPTTRNEALELPTAVSPFAEQTHRTSLVPEEVDPQSAQTRLSSNPRPPRVDLDDTAATVTKAPATVASSPRAMRSGPPATLVDPPDTFGATDEGPTLAAPATSVVASQSPAGRAVTVPQPQVRLATAPLTNVIGRRHDTMPMPPGGLPPPASGPALPGLAPPYAPRGPRDEPNGSYARLLILAGAIALVAIAAIVLALRMRATPVATDDGMGSVTGPGASGAVTATASTPASATPTATAAATATATASATVAAPSSATTTVTVIMTAATAEPTAKVVARPPATTKPKPVRPHPPGSSATDQSAYDHP